MQSKFIIFVFTVVIGICQGQILIPGECRDLPVIQDFDVAEYMGDWFEIEKFYTIFEAGGKCNQAAYDIIDAETVYVYNSLIYFEGENISGINGTARLNSTDGSAKLAVKFSSVSEFEAPYWVLDTDYINYSVVWSCVNIAGGDSRQSFWFLSRERFPSPAIRHKVYSVMAQNDLPIESLLITNQHACPGV